MKKKLRQIDYMCEIGERVFWTNLRNERFEGIIMKWNTPQKAIVRQDNGVESIIEC